MRKGKEKKEKEMRVRSEEFVMRRIFKYTLLRNYQVINSSLYSLI